MLSGDLPLAEFSGQERVTHINGAKQKCGYLRPSQNLGRIAHQCEPSCSILINASSSDVAYLYVYRMSVNGLHNKSNMYITGDKDFDLLEGSKTKMVLGGANKIIVGYIPITNKFLIGYEGEA